MPAVVTDQFRIANAGNFVDSVLDSNNSYYVFLGLPNPDVVGFGRTTSWPSNPIDNQQYLTTYRDTSLFGKKINSSNITSIDSKTLLQEYSLKKFKTLPTYKLISNTGPRHNPTFKVAVKIKNSLFVEGVGNSKKNAEQSAAHKILKTLNI